MGNTETWKILSSNPTDGIGQDGSADPHYEAPDNLQVGHVECVWLTISYPLFFLCISKVSSMLHHDSVEWFHSKEWYLSNVHPTPFLLPGWEGGSTSNRVFKKGGLAGPKLLEGVAMEEGVTFSWGLQFSDKK